MDFLQTDYAGKENKLKLLYIQEALFPDIVGGGGGGGRTRVTNANQWCSIITINCRKMWPNQFIAE